MSKWIKVSDRLPENLPENDDKVFYTFSYGEVRDDQWFSLYPRKCDGWGCECQGMSFYTPNSDPDCGGEFKTSGVTHWMEKPSLPESPSEESK